ncbi:uncharacterized protein LOC125231175 [Leguminivora glycinivorella]|uniref:uncharacterized protein LOC125231175 n=1 Tax=Leguminivora glycinivorella TaxID=1035111 RepID=UPI00200DBE2E|nr:uncharacterized protein LOC125231175 [Leguminivora glycinivorella]
MSFNVKCQSRRISRTGNTSSSRGIFGARKITMANKKQSDEEKRLKHKMKERERRRRIKSDPVLNEAMKQKIKEKYARKKAEGKITKLHEEPRKIQKILKQKNRESSKKHYYKKKKEAELVLNERLIDIPINNVSENVLDPLTQSLVQSQLPSSIAADVGETFSAQVDSASNLREASTASSRSFTAHHTANCNIAVDVPSPSTRS